MNIDPGEGYRLLELEKDTLQAGDEAKPVDEWKPVWASCIGEPVHVRIFRRKLDASDGWILFSERAPSRFPCQILTFNRASFVAASSAARDGYECVSAKSYQWIPFASIYMWKPLQLSDPPKPEKPKEELAFEEWYNSRKPSNNVLSAIREAWFAAWKAKQ